MPEPTGDARVKPTRRRPFRFGFALLALWASAATAAAGDPLPIPPRTTPPVAPAPHPTTDSYGDWLPAGATARFGSLRLRHLGMADYVVRPDGRTVRTVGRDGFLRTWDVESGRQIEARPLGGAFAKDTCSLDCIFPDIESRPTVGQLTFSPDRRFLAATFPTRIVVWDAETGRELKSLERPTAGLRNAVFSPNGQTLAVRAWNRLTLLEWRTDREWPVNYHVSSDRNGNENGRWQFSPDSRYLIVSEGDVGRVHVYAVGSARAEARYELARCFHNLTAVSPDGKRLVVGPLRDNVGLGDFSCPELLVLDLATGKEQGRVKIEGYGCAVAFSPDGTTLAVSAKSGEKGVVQLLDPATCQPRARYALDAPPDGLAFSPNGKRIACSYDDFPGRALDPSTGRVIRDIRKLGDEDRTAVTPGGRWFWGWDVATGRDRDDRPSDFAPPQDGERWWWLHRLVAAPDGRSVGAVHRSDRLALWDTADGRFIRYADEKGRWDQTIAFSADGRTRVAAEVYEGRLHFFDVRTDGERRMLQLAFYDFTPGELMHTGFDPQKNVWVSPDLRRVVTSAYDGLETTRLLIRDLSGAEPQRRLSFAGIVAVWAWPNVVAWVPKDGGTGLAVVSAVTGRTRVAFSGDVRWNDPLALSPDGRLLAVFFQRDPPESMCSKPPPVGRLRRSAADRCGAWQLLPIVGGW